MENDFIRADEDTTCIAYDYDVVVCIRMRVKGPKAGDRTIAVIHINM